MYNQIKCKKCRNIILNTLECADCLVSAHHQPVNGSVNECHTNEVQSMVFLAEDSLPEWVRKKVEEAQWSKGRLNCVNCDSRIGGFDFISGNKCQCSKESILPAVHLIKSKVDLVK